MLLFRNQQDRFTIIVHRICTIAGDPNGMVITITHITQIIQVVPMAVAMLHVENLITTQIFKMIIK